MSVDIARNNISRYGHYPSAMTFANNDHVADLADSTKPAYSAAFDVQDGIKRHAACDECRMIFGKAFDTKRSNVLQERGN